MIKSMRMRQAGFLAQILEVRNAHKIVVGKFEMKRLLTVILK
jgi:hypothetical protein